jgi:hypothetical protein
MANHRASEMHMTALPGKTISPLIRLKLQATIVFCYLILFYSAALLAWSAEENMSSREARLGLIDKTFPPN